MGKNRYEVEGFSFENADQAKQAQKEIAGIKYIQSKVDMDNPEMVLQIYNKTIREKLFETPVGIAYLRSLWEYLKQVPYIKDSDILSIPVEDELIEIEEESADKERKTTVIKKNIDYKKKYKTAFFFVILLFTMVVSMFAITLTSDSTTIVNYENKIINQYEDWEQELNEREQQLDEREAALDEKDTVSP